MVDKLKSKIFYIIMITFSIITIGIIILFTYYNYRNTINTSTFLIDRVFEQGEKPPKELQEESQKPIVDGFYSIKIKNGEILSERENLEDEVKQYTLEISSKGKETGIKGDYIYRVRKEKNNEIDVMLFKNEEAVHHIKLLIISAIIISIFALIIIYMIAKKVSTFIVKPVEKTFEKQIQFISDSSHELKTPLSVIEANADVLENEIGQNKWLRVYSK